MRKVWTMLSFICIFQMAYSQNYNLHVGEDKFLGIPFTNYVVTGSAQWNCTHRQIDARTDDKESGVIITIKQYFSDVATISVTWTEEYFNTHTGHSQFTAHSHTWTIRCIPVNIRLSESNIEMKPGDTKRLNYSWSESGWSSVAQVNWVSSDPSIATVESGSTSYNSYATITAKKPGNITITANTNIGPSAVCNVTVKAVEPNSVSLPSTASIKVGESLKLTPTLYPSDAETIYTWSSDNTSVATVSQNGEVSGKKTGTANIIVKTTNGKTATCRVTVEKGDLTLSCNTESGLIAKGTKVTLTANRSDAEIYYTIDGSTPTRKSTRYNGSIIINEALTLKAIATGSEYNISSLLTREYQVTSLVATETYPSSGSTVKSQHLIPVISFSDKIRKGSEFSKICLSSKGQDIEGNCYILDNKLYYLPNSEKLSNGDYKLSIPKNAVMNYSGEPNLTIDNDFIVCFKVSDFVFVYYDPSLLVREDGSLWAYNSGRVYPDDMDYWKIDNITSIYSGNADFVIKKDGSLWVKGEYNEYGQQGTGNTTPCTEWTKILNDVKKVQGGTSSGRRHNYALKNDGTLWAWGWNEDGQLGTGTKQNVYKPQQILSNVKIKDFATSATHTVAVTNSGSLYEWDYAHRDNNLDEIITVPTRITWLSGAAAVAEGEDCTYVIKDNGELYVWGYGQPRYMGIGNNGVMYEEVALTKIMSDVKKVITPDNDNRHALALKKDGSLWEWGNNGSGLKLSPEKLLDDITIFYRNIAVKNDGTVLVWSNRREPHEISIPFKMCPEIEKVSFPSEQVSMAVNDILLLIPSIEPIDGDYTNIKYSSSDEQVALVTSRGVVTAKQPGTTNITVTVDGQFTATCKVTVEESTGINEVESKRTADGHIYSLSGQRLAAPKKGINIINGRKVIVK